jgi:hypothetical protein
MSFLEFNPDLAEELEGLEQTKLEAAQVHYELKSSLRKPSENTSIEQIEREFEGYCLASVEKQLSPIEERFLQELLEKDASRQKIYELYESSILIPDTKIQYGNKSRLKKRFILGLPARVILGAASAAAVLLISLLVYINPGPSEMISDFQEPVGSEDLNMPEESAGTGLEHSETSPDNMVAQTEKHDRRSPEIPKVIPEKIPEEDREVVLSEEFLPLSEKEPLLLAKLESRTLSMIEFPVHAGLSQNALRLQSEGYDYVSLDLIARRENTRKKRISFWKLAENSINRINQVSEEDYSLDRETDENGRTRRFTFETPLFGISAPTRSTNPPR